MESKQSLDQISGGSYRLEKYRAVTLLNHNIGVVVAVIYDGDASDMRY